MAKKTPARKKKPAKRKPAKKAAAKKTAANSANNKSLAALLSKIQVELANGKRRQFSKRDISDAQDCLKRTGKVLISFKRTRMVGDGTGSGTGTGTTID